MIGEIIKPLIIGDLVVPIPVIQAGMGVKIASAELAGAVARAGAIGCISSVGLSSLELLQADYICESSDCLKLEIQKARKLAPNGVLAINVMNVISNYDEIVSVCVQEKVDIIISGAGLPLKLPELTIDSNIKLVPVISSGRALELILRTWHRRYQKLPDAVIVEGPLCGGHMGFSYDQLADHSSILISDILKDVKQIIAPYEAEYGVHIPIIGAEAVSFFDDVMQKLEMGFDGVQIGTRFICTEEANIARKSKEVYVKAKSEDIIILNSPLGMPVKVLRTPLSEKLIQGKKIPFGCPFQCLRGCKAMKVNFCIADALFKTADGLVDEGLFMSGSDVGKVNDIIPAEEFFVPFKKYL